MIDGVPLSFGCQGSLYKSASVYDLFIINLTMDDHPMHIHLINFQVIARFAFNAVDYRAKYEAINGPLGARGYNKIPTPVPISYPTDPTQIKAPLPE